MTITISLFTIACFATILLWVACSLWPIERSYGHFDFGGAFDAILHMVVAVVGTLIIWLVYFMAKSWGWA